MCIVGGKKMYEVVPHIDANTLPGTRAAAVARSV